MTAETEREPLNCPFCGEDPVEHAIEAHQHVIAFAGIKMPDHEGSHVIECACGAGMIDSTREAVLERWNRRASIAVPPERNALRPDHPLAGGLCSHNLPMTDHCPACAAASPERVALPEQPNGAMLDQKCLPNGVMFDAFGNKRVRYVRVSYDGSHLILSLPEVAAWRMEAEAAAASIGQTDPHTYSDVYLSQEEADALPEFDGF